MNGAPVGIDIGTTGVRAALYGKGAEGVVLSKSVSDVLDIPSLIIEAREAAEVDVKDFVTFCALALPVSTSSAQREQMLRAANAAGFEDARIIDCPGAAASSFGRPGRLLILDFGAEAEISVVEGEGVNWEILDSAVRGGARDFDSALADWLRERVLLPQMEKGSASCQLLLQEAEKIKIALSGCSAFRWTPPRTFGPRPELTVERDDLERIMRFPLRGLAHTVMRLWSIYEPDRLIMIGAAARIPMLRDILIQELGCPERIITGSEDAVARGAALYAFRMSSAEKDTRRFNDIKLALSGISGSLTRQQQERLKLILASAGSAPDDPEILELAEEMVQDIKRAAA